jgi:hypothetical protein
MPFQVVGQEGTVLSLLVDTSTTPEQLRAFVRDLRSARKKGRLADFGIPPTTLGGSAGDHGIVMIFVFTEPAWATQARLRKSLEVSGSDPYYREFGEHVRAYYYFTAAGDGSEEGMLGYAEGSEVYSRPHELLFRTGS